MNISVYAVNTGNVDDNYTYQAHSDIGIIPQKHGDFPTASPNGTAFADIEFQAPSVGQGGQFYHADVRVCSNYVFNGGVCDEKTCQGFIAYKQPPQTCVIPLIIPCLIAIICAKNKYRSIN